MMCKHRWDAISAKESRVIGFAMTDVLYQCSECGEHKVRKINGHWAVAISGLVRVS